MFLNLHQNDIRNARAIIPYPSLKEEEILIQRRKAHIKWRETFSIYLKNTNRLFSDQPEKRKEFSKIASKFISDALSKEKAVTWALSYLRGTKPAYDPNLQLVPAELYGVVVEELGCAEAHIYAEFPPT